MIPKLVKKDAKRLRRAVKAAKGLPPAPATDAALHEARKCAKRLRYAAEAAAPVGGKAAGRLADAAHGVQKTLGVHQDSVVARDVLRRLGVEAFLQGENGFTYGRLHALEESAATYAERRFRRGWKEFPSASLGKSPDRAQAEPSADRLPHCVQ